MSKPIMMISLLSHSPAQMFLDGIDVDEIKRQSQLYKIDKLLMRKYCKALERFYPELLETLRSQSNSQLSWLQWTVLYKSISHIFLSFLIDSQIVLNAKEVTTLRDDINTLPAVYPQTQEQLFARLPFDRTIRSKFLSAAFQLRRGKLPKKTVTFGFGNLYSFSNVKNYWIKRFADKKERVPSKSKKPRIVMVGAGPAESFLISALKKNYDLINVDPFIASINHFPRGPDWKLRKTIENELFDVFYQINLPQHFPVFSDRKLVAQVIAAIIVRLLPIQDVERFEHNQATVQSLLRWYQPNLVLTSAGHHDDLSNLLLGLAFQQQVPLLTLQHGSGYCEYASMQTERSIETLPYPTHYLSWGKGMKPVGKGNRTKVEPIGSPYLNAIPRHRFATMKITKVLIPLEPIYYYQILDGFTPSQPGFIAENYNELIKTLERIGEKYPQLTFIFKVKPGHERQFAVRQYLSDQLKERSQFTSKGKTLEYFDKNTLVLQTQLSGAFYEGLMAEIPFLLYFPANQRFIKKEADWFFDVLKKNYLCASTSNELVGAFDRHMRNEIAYKGLEKSFKQYQEWSCMRNPELSKKMDSIVQRLLLDTKK